jgi:hypothetical protein
MSAEEFEPLQNVFKQAIADAGGGVLVGSVFIDKVTPMTSSRRAGKIRVDISIVAADEAAANAIAANLVEDKINSAMKSRGLPEVRMIEKPTVSLTVGMDPVLRMFINVGVPIIAFFFVFALVLWIRVWYRSRQVKLGQDIIEDVVLKKLPMPTVEEVGEDVVMERELLKHEKEEGEGTAKQRVERKYKRQEIAKINKARKTAEGDKIAFDLDDFQYRDASKQIPKGVVSAFLTTGKFEAKSETTQDAGMLQTYQRLEKFKAAAGKDTHDMEELWGSEERVKDLIIAGARTSKSRRHPTSAAGVMPIVDDSDDVGEKKVGTVSSTITWKDFDAKPRTTTRNQLRQQVTAQHKKVSELGGTTTPSFLKDLQAGQIQKNPDPIKLGKRIEAAAARGPRDESGQGNGHKMLENGDGSHANGKSSRGLLGWMKSKKDKGTEGTDDDGLEVMV